jgi:hypothetical protein
MQFKPKTEEEIAAEQIMPVGEYDFEIAEASAKRSAAGNDMIVAKLKVYDGKGGYRLVTDYLMEKMAYKLRHFCEATGLLDRYENGDLEPHHCENRTGRVIIQIDPERKSEDGTKTFSSKNSVKDYVGISASGGTKKASLPSGNGGLEEDDIPFMRPHYLTVGGC